MGPKLRKREEQVLRELRQRSSPNFTRKGDVVLTGHFMDQQFKDKTMASTDGVVIDAGGRRRTGRREG